MPDQPNFWTSLRFNPYSCLVIVLCCLLTCMVGGRLLVCVESCLHLKMFRSVSGLAFRWWLGWIGLMSTCLSIYIWTQLARKRLWNITFGGALRFDSTVDIFLKKRFIIRSTYMRTYWLRVQNPYTKNWDSFPKSIFLVCSRIQDQWTLTRLIFSSFVQLKAVFPNLFRNLLVFELHSTENPWSRTRVQSDFVLVKSWGLQLIVVLLFQSLSSFCHIYPFFLLLLNCIPLYNEMRCDLSSSDHWQLDLKSFMKFTHFQSGEAGRLEY